MSELSERLQERMDELKLTQEHLASRMGLTRGQIGHYVRGRRVPPLDQIEKLEKILQVHPGWLQYGDEVFKRNHSLIKKPSNIQAIPVLKYHEIPDWVNYGKIPPNTRMVEMSGLINKLDDRYYLVPVIGDSMISSKSTHLSFYDGEYVLVDSKAIPKRGSIVVAMLSKTDFRIRQYQQDGSNFYLKAFDFQYPLIHLNEKIEIFGVVKQKITIINEGLEENQSLVQD